ncbi:MAG: short chain dehydrogenase [Arenicellales bacterium]|jgi:NAD(P)-dependent dehydrogenase (short-subunit alcohol dehydrogenase family)
MKVIVIGAGGVIGSAACNELGKRHDLIKAGRNSGHLHVDVTDRDSIDAMYRQAGKVDAVVCAFGSVQFAPLTELTSEHFTAGLANKVIGQVNVVLRGFDYVADGGSFTLISGVADRDPIRTGALAATANGALEGFVTGAAIEMPRGMRINVVSPGLLDVSVPSLGEFFPGHEAVSSTRVGLAFAKSVEGAITGKVIIIE